MPFNRKILIILRAGETLQPALDRGLLIAQRLQAEVCLMSDRPARSDSHREWLESVAKSFKDTGLQVGVTHWQRDDLIENLLEQVESQGYGLLVKKSDRNHPLSEAITTPLDWKLMRYTPCPVLMVRQEQNWEGRPLVAAIDADPLDADHQVLNRKILVMSQRIAALSQSPLHLVSAYPAPMQSTIPELQSETAIDQRYREFCQTLCTASDIEPDHQEVAEGPPEVMIPRYCREQDAGLVVMGTVARSGLRGALLGGNTAEAILAQLSADVLTLKPEGYEDILQLLFQQAQSAEGSSPQEPLLKEVVDE